MIKRNSIVLVLVALFFSTLAFSTAYFTDYFAIDLQGNVSSFRFDEIEDVDDELLIDMLPGDARFVSVSAVNSGSVDMDVRVRLSLVYGTLRTPDIGGILVYEGDDVVYSPEDGYSIKLGATPIMSSASTVEIPLGVISSQGSLSLNYAVIMDKVSSNDWQNIPFQLTIIVEGRQHQNSSDPDNGQYGWSALSTETFITSSPLNPIEFDVVPPASAQGQQLP